VFQRPFKGLEKAFEKPLIGQLKALERPLKEEASGLLHALEGLTRPLRALKGPREPLLLRAL
jgi:hypothetical protein